MKQMQYNSRFSTLFFLSFLFMLGSFFSCKKKDATVLATLPQVTTLPISDVTVSSVKSGGDITDNGNAIITAAGIVYSSTVTEPTLADDKISSTDKEGSFTVTLEGLNSGTDYYIRAYATNSKGTAYGEVVHFSTTNIAPTISGVTISGTMKVNEEMSAEYSYFDADGDAEGASTFKWYVADDATGSNVIAITGATSKVYTISSTYDDKFIAVGVTPVAATGTSPGVEVKSAYLKVGEAPTVTFMYNNVEVTYGVLTSVKTQRKWMDRNLGASAAPSSITDYANYGDLFQWGRSADGHQRVTRTGPDNNQATSVAGATSTVAPFEYAMNTDIPNTNKYIIVDQALPYDWRKPSNDNLWQAPTRTNNPCPIGWHVPTKEEWAAEVADNTIMNLNEAFSKLKITYTGIWAGTAAIFGLSTTDGIYWSSTATNTPEQSYAVSARFNNSGYSEFNTFRALGCAIRCIRDL